MVNCRTVNSTESQTANSIIDIFKLVASIMLLTMHLSAFNDSEQLGLLWQLLSRWCIPFFFVTSSYFLFSKKINKSRICKYCKRIGILYGLWFVYNIPSVLYNQIIQYGMSLNTLIRFCRIILLSSTFTGSWYLSSSIVSALVIFSLSKKLTPRCCLAVTFPFYFCCVLSSVYEGLLPYQIQRILNFACCPTNITCGIFYFAIGNFVANNKCNPDKLKAKTAFIRFAEMMLLFLIEVFLAIKFGYYNLSDQGLFLAPAAYYLLNGCLKIGYFSPNGILWRKISTIIYCAQGNIIDASVLLCRILGCNLYLIRYLIGAFMMSCVVIVILWITKRYQKKYTFLKYLT